MRAPKPLRRYAHKRTQALWPLAVTAALIGGAGAYELIKLLLETTWCRPLCCVAVGVGLAGRALMVRVDNEGGPIALLPTALRRWLLETSVLDAASEVALVVDVQHWIGVCIHAIQMLRLDSEEREEILAKLGPRVRRWATRPGLLRAIRPLHDALVWDEEASDDDVVARPVVHSVDADVPDAAAFIEAAAKINPWSTLIHIISRRAYRSLRANLSPATLAISAAIPAGLVAAVLSRQDHRLLARREGARLVLAGGAAAALVPFAAFLGLHVARGPEGHNDPDAPIGARAGPGALARVGALATVVGSAFWALASPAAWRTTFRRCVVGGWGHLR